MKVYCKYCGAAFHSPTKDLECSSCGNTEQKDFLFAFDDPIEIDNPLIAKWVEIGRKNYWIARSWDPEFNERSFYECETLSDLIMKLAQGNWSTGSAFYYKNMAFINQVNGGDEWMVVRDNIDFESWSCGYVINKYGPDYFATQFYQMFYASDEQLKNLDYRDVEVPDTFEFDGIVFRRVEKY